MLFSLLATGSLLLADAAVPSEASPSATHIEERALIQHHQLQLHQAFALATLGTMAVTAGLGLYDSHWAPLSQLPLLHTLHVGLGGMTTAGYLGAAALALTAPSAYQVEEEPGWDSVAVHRSLAWLHGGALASTVVLGVLTATGRMDPTWHEVAGLMTLGLMTVSAGVIALDF